MVTPGSGMIGATSSGLVALAFTALVTDGPAGLLLVLSVVLVAAVTLLRLPPMLGALGDVADQAALSAPSDDAGDSS